MTNNEVYIFKGEDQNEELACCMTVTNRIIDGEFIGDASFVAPRVKELIGKGYEAVYDKKPNQRGSKLNYLTRSKLIELTKN